MSISELLEALAKLAASKEIIIPGKRSTTRNPGFSRYPGFPLSRE
jgi:hypothetical protein